jgi:hypothetical protein
LRRLIVLAALVAIFLLALALPALAQESPSGCEIAHECGEQYLYALPPGYDISTSTSVYAYNPFTSSWGYSDAMWMHQFCYQYVGYYYWADDGSVYWNAC